MRIEQYRNTRYWAEIDTADTVVCLCGYRKGAEEVMRRLQALDDAQQRQDTNGPGEDVADDVASCGLCCPPRGQRRCSTPGGLRHFGQEQRRGRQACEGG